MDDVASWHHGVVAQWWDEFNQGGPEINYVRDHITRSGEPVLDVACGTGRLLLPYLRAGMDIDGVDVSADMLARCRRRATDYGLAPRLYRQALHELNLPRRYQTIFVCAGFGLGGDRERDITGLRHLYHHLLPGGTLILDHGVPYEDPSRWQYWLAGRRSTLPEPDQLPARRRTTSNGDELGLHVRIVEVDPLAQVVTYEVRACRWRDGALTADERFTLKECMYFRNEVLLVFDKVGFRDVRVEADHTGAAPTPDSTVLVYVARRPVE